MNKIYAKASVLGVFLMSFLAFEAASQTLPWTTGDFRTRADQTGRNWHGATGQTRAWQIYNGTAWTDYNFVPTAQGGAKMTVLAGTFVTINAGLTAGVPDGYELVIEDNAGVVFAANTSSLSLGSLTAPGSLVFDNTLNGTPGSISGNGTVNFINAGINSISGNGSISNMEINVSPAGSVDLGLGDEVALTGVLTVSTGTLNTNDGLTLKSSSTRTASVAPLGATGAISGQVNVERFFQNHRGWRLVTAPLSNIQGTIFDNWQNNSKAPGVELWGVNTNIGDHGLKSSGAFNLRRYTSSAYSNVVNTKVPMANNESFAMMVTGPYNSGNIGSGSAATTIRTTGTLVTGNKTISFTPGASLWGLVGNPYASAIDFEGVFTNSPDISANPFFWTIDPNVGPYGYYVIVNRTAANTYNVVPQGAGSTAQGRYIQSGQAFFVKANASGSTNINFQESDKTTSTANNSVAVMRTNNGDMEQMRVNLYSASASNPGLVDGTLLNFHQSQYSNNFNASEDFEKFTNTNENLWISNGTKKLIIEGRELAENGDEILVGMGNMKQQDYMLEIAPINMNANGMTATLIDNYLNTQQTISLNAVTNYNFVVNADPASASANRFKIVFGNATTSVENVATAEVSVNAYPNPAIGDNVKLEITNLEKGSYSISVYNTLGQLMTSQSLNHNGGTAAETVNLNSLTPGTYDVKVSDNKGNFETHTKIIKL